MMIQKFNYLFIEVEDIATVVTIIIVILKYFNLIVVFVMDYFLVLLFNCFVNDDADDDALMDLADFFKFVYCFTI